MEKYGNKTEMKKYGNETETGDDLFRPFLRDPVFFGLNPYLFRI
jgi:hypothetical protein